MNELNVLSRTAAALSASSYKGRQAKFTEVLATIKLQLNHKSQDK